MSAETDRVALRAFIEKVIHLQWGGHNREHRLEARALRLQTKELARRLEDLNGEQARLAADRERYLPRESFDLFLKEWTAYKDTVGSQLGTITRQAAASLGREGGSTTTWQSVATIISLLGLTAVAIHDFLH